VVQINLPPLRNRREDIPDLIRVFLDKFGALQPSIRAVSEEAMRLLITYDWPGNVRELENAIEHALALGAGPAIEVGDLPFALQSATNLGSLRAESEVLSLEELQRRAIFCALRKTNGDKVAAARLLQIGKTTLYRKLKQNSANERFA